MSRLTLAVENVSHSRSKFVYDAWLRPEQRPGRCDCEVPLRKRLVELAGVAPKNGDGVLPSEGELEDLCYRCHRSISGETKYITIEIVDPVRAPGHVFRIRCDDELEPGAIYDIPVDLPEHFNPPGLFWRTPIELRGRFRLHDFRWQGQPLLERPGGI